MSFGDEADIDFATAKGRDWPSVRQFNVFLSNRMGALLDLSDPLSHDETQKMLWRERGKKALAR